MVAGQPVPPAHVQCMHGFYGDCGQEGFLHGNGGQEPVCQGHDFSLDGVCCLLCPCYQVCEEFPDHCNNQSGTFQDLNRDDPLGSMNIMSDECAARFLCPDLRV
jgi:hypothetical protein